MKMLFVLPLLSVSVFAQTLPPSMLWHVKNPLAVECSRYVSITSIDAATETLQMRHDARAVHMQKCREFVLKTRNEKLLREIEAAHKGAKK
jgi:hypothetical protein